VFKKYKIKYIKNIINFNKTGIRIECIRFKKVIIPINIMELYKTSPENYKSITICKTIRVNGNESPSLFIIVSRIKVIEAWITQEFISEERIRLILIRYINNNIALKYLNHLILHL
jgi:hypothetical protein